MSFAYPKADVSKHCFGGIIHEVLGPCVGTWVVGCEERKGVVERSHVDSVDRNLALTPLFWGCWRL